jgi:hypothetical protein
MMSLATPEPIQRRKKFDSLIVLPARFYQRQLWLDAPGGQGLSSGSKTRRAPLSIGHKYPALKTRVGDSSWDLLGY